MRLLVDVQRDATVIPTSAVQRGAPGTFVYLINPDNTVAVRPVTLGVGSGERVAVSSGLSPGDRVVIDGADKLRNGAKVIVRESAPSTAAAPARPAAGAPASDASAPDAAPAAGEPRQRGPRRSRDAP